MGSIYPGRYAARNDGLLAVFSIGMRVNRLWAVHKWLHGSACHGPMVKSLLDRRELGLMHAESYLIRRGTVLVREGRSFEQWACFARDSSLSRLDAWKQLNRAVGPADLIYVNETLWLACLY